MYNSCSYLAEGSTIKVSYRGFEGALKSIVFALLLSVSSSIAVYFLGTKIEDSKKSMENPYEAPPLVTLKPEMINLLFLGKPSVYHHFLNIWLIQALMEEKPQESTMEPLVALIHQILHHKPPVPTLYMLACHTLAKTWNAPEACEPIIKAGLEVLPEDFRLLVTQGYIFAFKMNEPIKAAAYYYRAAQSPRSPPHVINVAKKLAQKVRLDEADLNATIQSILEFKKDSRLGAFLLDQQRNLLHRDPPSSKANQE